MVDLASQVTQNIAMVEEVLHTQRDFKEILLRLLNSNEGNVSTQVDPAPISTGNCIPVASLPSPVPSSPEEPQDPIDITAVEAQHSWMSADTVLLTPNTRNDMRPRSARDPSMHAVSTDVSDHSIANGSVNDSAGLPSTSGPGSHATCTLTRNTDPDTRMSEDRRPPPTLQDPHMCIQEPPAMATRGRTTPLDGGAQGIEVQEHSDLKFPPRASNDAIAVNKLCYLSHPDYGDDVVAEGRTGGSWKAKAQKFGRLCSVGEQMVQIHKVFVPHLRLLHLEERQAFVTIGDAVVKATGSNVYVKWNAKYLHKRVP